MDIAVGDRVIRRSGRTVVGVVERVYHPETWTGVDASRTLARVRWEKATMPFHGGFGDYHTSVSVDALRLATSDTVEQRRESKRHLTPAMRRAVALWRERVGYDWANGYEVFAREEAREHRAWFRIIARAGWPNCPEEFQLFECEVGADGRRTLRYRLREGV